MSKSIRFSEIDAWRGHALFAMAIYHFFYFLHYGNIINIPYGSQTLPVITLEAIGSFARNSFVFLVGISAALSYIKRSVILKHPFNKIYLHFLKRGILVILSASLISIGSYIFASDKFIYFGILHFIGLSIIFIPFFLYNKSIATGGLIISILVAFLVPTINLNPNYLTLILGLTTPYATIDYFPFLHWFPLIIFGGLVGLHLYTNYKSHPILLRTSAYVPKPKWLIYIGNHTFSIYFIHITLLLILTGILQIIFIN